MAAGASSRAALLKFVAFRGLLAERKEPPEGRYSALVEFFGCQSLPRRSQCPVEKIVKHLTCRMAVTLIRQRIRRQLPEHAQGVWGFGIRLLAGPTPRLDDYPSLSAGFFDVAL